MEERVDEAREHGFGTGLRAQLAARQAAGSVDAPRSPGEAVAAAAVPAPPPAPPPGAAADELRAELDASLAREQELRNRLGEQLDLSARELRVEEQLAARFAELESRALLLDEREAELRSVEQASRLRFLRISPASSRACRSLAAPASPSPGCAAACACRYAGN